MSSNMWQHFFMFGAACTVGLVMLRKRNLLRLQQHILNSKCIDIGPYFGLDVGGTLSKLVYLHPTSPSKISRLFRQALEEMDAFLLGRSTYGGTGRREEGLTLNIPRLGGELHFIRYETSTMERAVQFVSRFQMHRNIMTLDATGGGAHKFSRLFHEKLGIVITKCDEMDALIKGLTFVLKHAPHECYTWENVSLDSTGDGSAVKVLCRDREQKNVFPYLVVNIGSGVSILKVTGENQYSRVSGTSLGGGTFWGLARLLTRCQTFDESMDLSVVGSSHKADMLVGDIYGGNYDNLGLDASTLASSFGKMGAQDFSKEIVRDEDIARSLLVMITQNIGQVAYLNAKRHNTSSIYFCGNFLRRNAIASRQLAYAIDFWSKGKMQAQFFHHEGYFGALGAFLNRH